MKHFHNYSLLPHNTFGFDVVCSDFYEYDSKEELSVLYNQGVFSNQYLSVGGGSNLLLMNDLSYPVVHSNILGVEVVDERETSVDVYAGSGVVWDDFVQWCISRDLGGVENLSFIPGCVGASPVQNIGAYGVEAKDVIKRVDVYNTKDDTFFSLDNKECQFEYRGSVFKKEKHLIVVGVLYELTKGTHEFKLDYGNVKDVLGDKEVTLNSIRKTIVDIRMNKLPLPSEIGSAGSFFKNPVVDVSKFQSMQSEYANMPFYALEDGYKIPAAWLISQCGWKGKNIGAAGVYEKQPLILVNRGGAKGEDVVFLMKQIQLSVKDKFDIQLHPEVCLVR